MDFFYRFNAKLSGGPPCGSSAGMNVGHIVSHISEPPIEATKCKRKHHGHEQAPQSRNENMPCPTQLKLSNAAYEQVADNKVERAPKHIHHGGREPLPWGRGKRALERVPCNAAHKMRDRICEKGSAKKVRDIMIPTHIEFSFEKARRRWSPQILCPADKSAGA
mgnify:CR=1 FL=1